MTFQESISKAIELQRNRLGITATELSKRLGISRQYYYMLKSNDALWKIEQLGKVASALELKSVWELIDLAKFEDSLNTTMNGEPNEAEHEQ